MKMQHTITVKGKNYEYFLTSVLEEGEKMFFVECSSAGISQLFLAEDIAEFLEDLPQWISEFQKEELKKEKTKISFFVPQKERKILEEKARKKGYKSVASYVKDRAFA